MGQVALWDLWDRSIYTSNIREKTSRLISNITMTSKWARWRLKLPSSRLLTQPFIQGGDQRKHQSSASLAFVRVIHRLPVNSPYKGPGTRKMFPFDDVIMHCLMAATKYVVCRIKTGHSNLVSCFGPRMRVLAKVFYRGESRGKIPCQRPNPRAKTRYKIWMTGLNPNYDTIPIPSLQNSQNKRQKSSFTFDRRRHLILPLQPVHVLPTLNARICC